MAKRPSFTLPAGLTLEVTGDRLDLEFDGDVELEQDLGRQLGTIRVTGDLTIKLAKVTGNLHAGGTLRIQGDIDAGSLQATEIVLGRQSVTCTAISATESITVGAAVLQVDAILAPEINLDPKASGRVTVIESTNERGATKIKGGFSLADYDDMFGNAKDFLSQRGLEAPGGSAGAGAPAKRSSKKSEAKSEPEPEPEDAAELEPDPEAEPEPDTEPAPPADEEEDVDDPLSLSLDDLEPLVEQGDSAGADVGDLHQRLSDALGRITACYEGTDLPPAVEELRDLVEQRDYDALRQNITEVWNGLLGFHQKRGIRPHHQVTHAFNVIHGLVQG